MDKEVLSAVYKKMVSGLTKILMLVLAIQIFLLIQVYYGFWVLLSFVMFVPGCLKLYASFVLWRFRREPAGTLTFFVYFFQGALWTFLGIIVFFGAVFGNLILDLPLVISISLGIVFFADRLAAGFESLWMAGFIPNLFRKVDRK